MDEIRIVDGTGTTNAAKVDENNTLATNAIAISWEHNQIHEGNHYFVVGYADLSINQVLDFTWQMSNTTKLAHWTWSIDTEKETLWSVYENVIANNALANVVTLHNSNRNSANPSNTIMKFEVQANLAGANTDTNVTSPAILLMSGISGAGQKAGAFKREHELPLKQNNLYCLRSVANVAGYINFRMQWYERVI